MCEVGAGSAGSVLATRLSEDPGLRILLLEAGGEETANPAVPVPSEAIGMMGSKSSLWTDVTVPQKHACKGSIDSVRKA